MKTHKRGGKVALAGVKFHAPKNIQNQQKIVQQKFKNNTVHIQKGMLNFNLSLQPFLLWNILKILISVVQRVCIYFKYSGIGYCLSENVKIKCYACCSYILACEVIPHLHLFWKKNSSTYTDCCCFLHSELFFFFIIFNILQWVFLVVLDLKSAF